MCVYEITYSLLALLSAHPFFYEHDLTACVLFNLRFTLFFLKLALFFHLH